MDTNSWERPAWAGGTDRHPNFKTEFGRLVEIHQVKASLLLVW